MRRWNGWGDETISLPLPDTAVRLLREELGPAEPPVDARFEEVLARMPESRLAAHPLVSRSPAHRLTHSRGQSLPDWVALRSGAVDAFPDGVAYPETAGDVRTLMGFAGRTGSVLIPYGGGTSVVGHVNPIPGDRPVLTVDLGRINRLQDLEPEGRLAVLGAGAAGPEVESQLRAHGWTLGHFPQSFEYSTLGGWVATRSCGQQSLRYGRIERLFLGGRAETPSGPLVLPPFPASAAGPDLREMLLGSEGRMGILTEVAVRIRRLPEREDFHAVFFPEWGPAAAAARSAVQEEVPLSMLRLSNPAETRTTLALAGHPWKVNLMERYLSRRGAGRDRCLLLFGTTGSRGLCRRARRRALQLFKAAGGVHVGRTMGRKWRATRFRAPYLRNTLWEAGYAVDTLETAVGWRDLDPVIAGVESALRGAGDGAIHVFTHLSHVYAQGASVYVTAVFPVGSSAGETLERWRRLKKSASEAVVANRGTISHQHGVGVDHAPFLAAEKGTLGLEAIRAVCREVDPEHLMNPGKLV